MIPCTSCCLQFSVSSQAFTSVSCFSSLWVWDHSNEIWCIAKIETHRGISPQFYTHTHLQPCILSHSHTHTRTSSFPIHFPSASSLWVIYSPLCLALHHPWPPPEPTFAQQGADWLMRASLAALWQTMGWVWTHRHFMIRDHYTILPPLIPTPSHIVDFIFYPCTSAHVQ